MSYEHKRAIMESERNASLDSFNYDARLTLTEERLYETGFTNGWQRCEAMGAPAQAPMSPDNRLIAYKAASRLRELGFEWDVVAEEWLQPTIVRKGS